MKKHVFSLVVFPRHPEAQSSPIASLTIQWLVLRHFESVVEKEKVYLSKSSSGG